MPVTTPVSLLERLREADFNAPDWTEFVQLYTPVLLRWARGLGIQPHDADDLVQDVLLKLRTALPRFVRDENRGRFRDWLRVVAVRRWYEVGRQRRLLPVDLSEAVLLDSDAGDPAHIFEEAEFQAFVIREMMRVLRGRVSVRSWRACYETVAIGRKAREVGRELGMSEAAVQMARSRVLRILRRELKGLLD